MSMAGATETATPVPLAQRQSRCFACGHDNPHGLRIDFRVEDDGAATAAWKPSADFEGFEGIAHGGIVTTVLDEAMSKVVAASGHKALTAELRIRLRHPVTTGDTFSIHGWIVKSNRRLVETEASLCAADGTEHAHGWAMFLEIPHHAAESPVNGRGAAHPAGIK